MERGLEQVQGYLRAGEFVVASLAPSFPVSFAGAPGALVAALRQLGFAYVEETAVAARFVALEHRRVSADAGRPLITSSCPSLLSLVGKYYPEALEHIAPIVSPMVAHGRMLRQAHPGRDIRVVFIGPCAAKKAEVADPCVAGAVDVALSYLELEEWLAAEGLTPGDSPPPPVPSVEPGRIFPVEGGLFRTADLPTDLIDESYLVVSGFEECVDFLKSVPESLAGYRLVEMLICPGGCVNGPLMPELIPAVRRRRHLLDYVSDVTSALPRVNDYAGLDVDLSRGYEAKPMALKMPTEEEIVELLARTDKRGPEDELNCGACGYESCREKAIAVYQGMAELEMCLPYMRRQAESTTARFIQQTPIGIVVVDRKMNIVLANPAWCALLGVDYPVPAETGLSGMVSTTVFRRALRSESAISAPRLRLPKRGRYVDLHVFPLPKEDALVGVFMDITTQEQQREELLKVREETLQRTQEVVERQMRTAQEIAGLLGETTADTKALLAELMELVRASNQPRTEP